MRWHVSLNQCKDPGSEFVVKKARNNLNGHSSVFPAQGIVVVDDDIGGIDGEEAGGVLEQSFVGQGGFEKLRDESEEKENENDAGMRVEGGIELGEVKKMMDGGHDGGVIGEVDEEGEGVAAEEVHVESVGGGVEAAKREDAGGEEGEGKEGREEAEGHGFLEELPGHGKVIVEADVGDQAVGQLDGREGDAAGVEGGADLDGP